MEAKERTFVEEAGEKRKIDLKIGIEDFGPISDGEITLKPLTVFIGPNNSGKSYAAMLIHSVFESHNLTSKPYTDEAIKGFLRSSRGRELVKRFSSLEEGENLGIPMEEVTEIALEGLYGEILNNEIVRSFACRLDELASIGKSSFSLKISHDSFNIHLVCQEGKLRIEEHSPLDQLDTQLNTTVTRTVEFDRGNFLAQLLDLVISAWSKILENMLIQCHYLPAARSGILQGHKALAANILRRIPYAGIRDLDVPKFSGVVSDFLSSIIELREKRGDFYQLARDFEDELIRGEIVVPTTPSDHPYPEIKYSFKDTMIPLHRSSSTVSELAPLFLYLKYKVRPGSVLMIEEPEAHLHPRNQRILARLLVRLVRGGVNLVITTHSEYLLEQLSNFIMLSKVEPEKRAEKYQYSKEDFLNPDEFAAYVFNYDEGSGGYRIDEVEVTEEDGISDEEFAKIYEALYEEMIKLRMDLSGES